MAINTGDLNSLYKVAYAKGVEDLMPEVGMLIDRYSFVPSELQNGKQYEQPVVLTGEQGFTYSLDSQSAYDLNDSIGMSMQSAIVPGCDVVLDSTVGYNQAARASHNATAFKSVMSTKFENMLKSTQKRVEIGMLYGNKPIASTAAQTIAAPSSTLTFTVTTASWATGIWSGLENANIVFVKASDNTAVDSLRSFKVYSVNPDSRTVTVAAGTAGTAGTLLTLETALEAYACNIHFYGAVSGSDSTFAYAEQAGLQKIITNTGELFEIDAAVYDLWRGNSVTISGQLTMSKVLAGAAKAVQRGLNSEADLWCNPSTWADLASNLAALRRFDGSYSTKSAKNGSETLQYVSQSGVINIHSYNLVKEGDAFLLPKNNVIRIGARDIGLNDPTRPQDEIFFTIPGKAGVGLRAYTNQQVFLETPAQAVFFSGITNSA